jgi:tetratricopeptide (TPR) repeat protein
LIGIACGVLLVNLLAAGGISFPGVATSFWTLLALGMCGWEECRSLDREYRATKSACYSITFVLIGLLAAVYVTAYRPVLALQTEFHAAYSDLAQAEDHLQRAAEADPWSAEPWIQLSNLAYKQWTDEPTPERFETFLQTNQEVLDRIPQKAESWFVFAEWNEEAYRRMGRPAEQTRALDAYRTAVELYPGNSLYRAKWALALQTAGKEAESRREAEKSLELDHKNPHSDKRLPAPIRKLLEKIVE